MSNGFDFDPPEEFASDSNYLKTKGTYHLAIVAIGTEGKDGKLLDGFRVSLEVLDGTTRDKTKCTELKKQTNVTFFNGKLTDKDGGKFRRQVQAAFFVAAGIFDSPARVAAIKAKEETIDLETALGHQIICTLDVSDKGYMELAGASVYHVDDPAAAAFPKNDKALGLLPQSLRHTPAQLEAIKAAFGGKKKEKASHANGNGSGKSDSSSQAQQPVGAGVGSSLDDL